MGTLEYNSSHPPIHIDDATLAHVKVIIGTKLRRQESFMMTWLSPTGDSSGRMTAWVHPSIPLVLAFDDQKMPSIDRARIARMMDGLNAHGELVIDTLSDS
ncbi:hypothetical protein [Microbacterium sp. 3J1]|uniref:DUF7882 family protein n=1 Tax=Microbacterium sp. 3J1 TaxID=861269 RepID=UPI000A8C4E82|nr:hypothetical protein [Microbacterium sp. 3J1]